MGLTQKLGTIPLAIFTDASNNIGIGGSPSGSYKFDVTGTGRFTGALTAGSGIFGNTGTGNNVISISNNDQSNTRLRIINTGSGGQTFSIVGGNPGVSNAGLAIFDETNSATRLYIGSTGNVGIGTNSPSVLLHAFNSSGTAELRLERGGTGDVGMRWRRNGSDLGYVSNADWIIAGASSTDFAVNAVNNLIFGTGASERMRITSGGNVGIGSTGYSAIKLQITSATSDSSSFALSLANSSVQDLFYVRSDGYTNMGTRSNSPYNYNATFSPRACVLDAGGGIGYSTSTRESKINIESLNDITWLYQLNPVSFNYRKKDDENNYTDEAQDEKWYGLIADEVESINQDLVFYNTKEDGTKTLAGVEYNKLISALVKSVQELSAKVSALENKS
jgi:hypothetical protein